jgi:predicted O-linked N-acetylglucosamine transferase (SPINDLY family)
MDYAIVDAITDPPGAEEFYTEKLIRMSRTSLCHVLLPLESPAAEPPVRQNGYITFGCFCNTQKMTAETISLLARTVKSVKGSCLLLKGKYSDELAEDMRKRFFDEGLPQNRLTIEPQEAGENYPKSYHRIDIVLDTIPFNGATTTCDALNMGVPVVTIAGNNQSSRRGLSILRNVGLDELIASTQEEYIKIAVELAGDIKRLEFYRCSLRKMKSESNLADAKAFVEEYLFHVRKVWIDYCREHKIPLVDYSQKTDTELKDEMYNAKNYVKYDSSEDVLEEYRRLEAEYTRRGAVNEPSIS